MTPPDDLLHDLVGAAVDAGDARVGEGARDRVLEHVAVAAEELQAAVDDAALQLGAPPLRHRGVLGRELAGVQRLRAAVDEGARDLDFAVRSSASVKREAWKEPIGWPNALRSRTYSSVQSSAASAAATADAAIDRRSWGRLETR